MGFGYREAGTGGVFFPEPAMNTVRVGGGGNAQRDIIDSQENYYPIDARGRVVIPRCRHKGGSESWSNVVTSANGFHGSVKWIGGARVKIDNKDNKIKISFDSTASDESPWDSSGGDDHDTKTDCDDPSGGGGVSGVPVGSGGSGGVGGGGSGGGFPDYSGGVSAEDGQTEHGGGTGCCD